MPVITVNWTKNLNMCIFDLFILIIKLIKSSILRRLIRKEHTVTVINIRSIFFEDAAICQYHITIPPIIAK